MADKVSTRVPYGSTYLPPGTRVSRTDGTLYEVTRGGSWKSVQPKVIGKARRLAMREAALQKAEAAHVGL